jgi:hypothetical protein
VTTPERIVRDRRIAALLAASGRADFFKYWQLCMTPKQHRQRHVELHQALDELIADFLHHTGELPSHASILRLMEWSYSQTKQPTATGPDWLPSTDHPLLARKVRLAGNGPAENLPAEQKKQHESKQAATHERPVGGGRRPLSPSTENKPQ